LGEGLIPTLVEASEAYGRYAEVRLTIGILFGNVFEFLIGEDKMSAFHFICRCLQSKPGMNTDMAKYVNALNA
jgi:hypothetical protein